MNKKLLFTVTLALTSLFCWAQTDISTGLSFSIDGGYATINGLGNHAETGTLVIPTTVNDGKGNYTVTALGNWAFQNKAISSVQFPNTLTTIGMGSFSTCPNLTSVTLPSSVKTITEYAFEKCNKLKSVAIQGAASIKGSAFSNCPALSTITMPNVIFIGGWAFQNCTSLTSITMPNGVTSIEGGTFSGCSKLSSVTIPSNIKTVAEWAFEKSGLTTLTLPATVTALGGQGTFSNCPNLTSVTYNSPVADVLNMFNGCAQLSTVNMVNSTAGTSFTTLDRAAGAGFFGGIPSTTVVTLPANTPASGAAYDNLVATLNGTPIANYIFPTSTGIDGVTVNGDNVNTTIYTIDGKFVGTDINTLPKGFYIVNGKKVIK